MPFQAGMARFYDIHLAIILTGLLVLASAVWILLRMNRLDTPVAKTG